MSLFFINSLQLMKDPFQILCYICKFDALSITIVMLSLVIVLPI